MVVSPRRHDQPYASSSHNNASASPSSPRRPSNNQTKFFPPPFRIDLADVESPEPPPRTAQPCGKGDQRRPLGQPAKKKRRLLFTSELPPPDTHDEQGNPSVAYLRYQSTMRLKQKWDSIYERFKDAHLVKQDELYLGRGTEKIRLIKDNGVLRGFKENECTFGSFHIKEEDLDEVERELMRAKGQTGDLRSKTRRAQGCPRSAQKARCGHDGSSTPRTSSSDDDDDDDDDFIILDSEAASRQWESAAAMKRARQSGGGNGSEGEGPDVDERRPPDQDLLEFLAAEAKRRALMGDLLSDQEDDDDDVVDFRDRQWTRNSKEKPTIPDKPAVVKPKAPKTQKAGKVARRPGAGRGAALKVPTVESIRLVRPMPSSSSDDEMDLLVDSPKTRDDFQAMMAEKRDNTEKALRNMTGMAASDAARRGGVLPYDDVPGLAELLGVQRPPDERCATIKPTSRAPMSFVARVLATKRAKEAEIESSPYRAAMKSRESADWETNSTPRCSTTSVSSRPRGVANAIEAVGDGDSKSDRSRSLTPSRSIIGSGRCSTSTRFPSPLCARVPSPRPAGGGNAMGHASKSFSRTVYESSRSPSARSSSLTDSVRTPPTSPPLSPRWTGGASIKQRAGQVECPVADRSRPLERALVP